MPRIPLFVAAITLGWSWVASGAADRADLEEKEFTSCRKYPEDKRFRLSLHGEVGVGELVAVVGDIACQTIILGSAAASHNAKVTIEVPDLVTAPEVFRLFHAALESMGLTIQRNPGVWKVVDSARGKEVSALARGAVVEPGEEFVTRLVRVQHSGVAEIGEVLNHLRSHDGEVTLYVPGQALILTDHASNVRRMEELARALDVEGPGERIFGIAVHSQSATEVAATIDKIMQATRHTASNGNGGAPDKAPRASGNVTLVPADSARMLFVIGDEASYRRAAAIAQRIDPANADGGSSQAHVIYLSYTNAEDVAATLKELGLVSRTAVRPGATSTQGGVPTQGDVKIGADKVSNAIVVFANGPDFLMVRDLISRLDLPRRQVYVEVAILDLSITKTKQLGLSAHGGDTTSGGTSVVGASSSSSLSSLTTSAASLASMFASGGLTTGIFGSAFTIDGISVPSFGVVLKALETDKDVNVISQPHLLTMDNVKASLSVGQSIPFQTQSLGALASTTASASLLSSYQRQDVALKLELTPHLNDSDSIRLELDGEISDVPDGQSTSTPGGPTTDKRTIKTAVVIGDGETVVLGGLVKDSETTSVDKVPGLGDIPILGKLFQYKSRQRQKQDLMIAITPYVIRGPDDLRRIFERKQADQREFDERWNPHPSFDAPIDYGRQRGLLEQINVTAREAEREAATVREAAQSRRRPPIEGELQ